MIAYILQQASTKSLTASYTSLQRIVENSETPDADSLDMHQDEEVLAEEAVLRNRLVDGSIRRTQARVVRVYALGDVHKFRLLLVASDLQISLCLD